MVGLIVKAIGSGVVLAAGIVAARIVNKQLDQIERGEMPTFTGTSKSPKPGFWVEQPSTET